jgi:Domain of unknown function (DUF4349)
MPATDTDFEREFAELVARLREVPTEPPDSLRARVRALGEPDVPPTLRDRVVVFPWRRAVLVAAPACVAVLLSVAVVRGVVSSGGSSNQPVSEVAATHTTTWGAKGTPRAGVEFGAATASGQRGIAGAGTGGRAVDYDASLRVRVRDADALSEGTADAMRIARSFNGYVASLQQSATAGRPGQADLVLRIPVGHVEEAVAQLASLGTVVDQHLSIVDLQQTIDQQRRRIRSLRYQVARLNQALRNPSLTQDVRLRLQFLRDQVQAQLTSLTRAHKGTLREAALSEISLSLTTQRAAGAVAKHDEGRFERAARNAASFLSSAGAVALFLLIALSPLLAVAAAWFYGSRAYRRREERRLLAPAPE